MLYEDLFSYRRTVRISVFRYLTPCGLINNYKNVFQEKQILLLPFQYKKVRSSALKTTAGHLCKILTVFPPLHTVSQPNKNLLSRVPYPVHISLLSECLDAVVRLNMTKNVQQKGRKNYLSAKVSVRTCPTTWAMKVTIDRRRKVKTFAGKFLLNTEIQTLKTSRVPAKWLNEIIILTRYSDQKRRNWLRGGTTEKSVVFSSLQSAKRIWPSGHPRSHRQYSWI